VAKLAYALVRQWEKRKNLSSKVKAATDLDHRIFVRAHLNTLSQLAFLTKGERISQQEKT
jgi:hypothetical protein